MSQTELPLACFCVCFALCGASDGWGLLQWGEGVCSPAAGLSAGSRTPRVLQVLDARCKPSLFMFSPRELAVSQTSHISTAAAAAAGAVCFPLSHVPQH